MKNTILLIAILCPMLLYSCNNIERDYQKLADAKIEFANSK